MQTKLHPGPGKPPLVGFLDVIFRSLLSPPLMPVTKAASGLANE